MSPIFLLEMATYMSKEKLLKIFFYLAELKLTNRFNIIIAETPNSPGKLKVIAVESEFQVTSNLSVLETLFQTHNQDILIVLRGNGRFRTREKINITKPENIDPQFPQTFETRMRKKQRKNQNKLSQ